MRNNIIVLGALLVLQVALAAWLALTGNDFGVRAAGEPLLAFERSAVQRIRLADAGGASMELVRDSNGWTLPDHHGFPAAEGKVKRLLRTLQGLAPPLPLATSADAAKRFRVAEDGFERRIELLDGEGDTVALLYVGDSPGFRRAYVRPDGVDAVYETGIDRASITAEPSAWTDRMALRRDASELERIEADDVTLVRDNQGQWQVDGVSDGRVTDRDAVERWVRDLTLPRFDQVAGGTGGSATDAKHSVVVTLTPNNGEEVAYRLVSDGEDAYTLTVSDKPWRFRLTKPQARALMEVDKEALTRAAESRD